MQDLFGQVIIVEEEEARKDPNWLFMFLDSVRQNKRYAFSDENKPKYNPYMMNRFLSMDSMSNTMFANDMNIRAFLDKRLQYDYFFYALRKGRGGVKYIKATKDPDIEAVREYFGYSTTKAREAMKILDEDDIMYIKKKISTGSTNG